MPPSSSGLFDGVTGVITALTGLVAAIGVLYNIVQNQRQHNQAQKARKELKDGQHDLAQSAQVLETQTNGILSKLIDKKTLNGTPDDTTVHKAIEIIELTKADKK